MADLGESDIIKALDGVQDPDLGKDLTELGMIKDVSVNGGIVSLTVELTTPACPLKDKIASDVRDAIVSKLDAITEVDINFTSSVKNSFPVGHDLLPGVRNILLIGSGKGGVGKSTIASSVALALAQSGAAVGLLDADIYGPSLPTIFGIKQPPETTQDQQIVPPTKFGIKLMSMGMLLEEGQPVVWRGPMLDAALKQFLGQVVWGELDYLVVDLPPGTGDVQLSLARMVPHATAVIVTTPQDIALADVKRAYNMFQQVNMNVAGVIENMSGFVCSHCGERTDIFLSGGGKQAANMFAVEFFGEVPLSEEVVRHTDSGTPALIEDGESTHSQVIKSITGKIAQWLAVESSKNPPPESVSVDGSGGHAPPISVPPGQAEPPKQAEGFTRF